jgi:hypothetical protein
MFNRRLNGCKKRLSATIGIKKKSSNKTTGVFILIFFSLYKPDRQSTPIVESGATLAEIDHNAILDEFATQHDRETELFYNGRRPN